MNQILLFDDDHELKSLLKEMLNIEGLDVLVSYGNEQNLNLNNNKIDLFLLDVIIPKKNSIESLKKLHKIYQTPVIILTAYNHNFDYILGLGLNSNNYLSENFKKHELVSKIKYILQSSYYKKQYPNHEKNSTILMVDSLILDPGRQEAIFDGKKLELTGTEFTLLHMLAQHLGKVVSREHLSQTVLGKRLTPFDRSIDMHISNIRHKLPERKDGYPWFKTLRGRGYLMVSSNT